MRSIRMVASALVLLGFAAVGASGQRAPQEPRIPNGFLSVLADSTLDRLVAEALQGSAALRATAARREGAGAERLGAALQLTPSVGASAGYARRRFASATFPGTEGGPLPDQSLWESSLNLTWEVDLFGRLRNGLRARDALVGSADADLQGAEIRVTAEVLRAYFELRGTQGQLGVARRNAENQQRTLRLTEERHEAGRGNAFDTERGKAQLSLTLSAIPLLEERAAAAQHRIAVLVGRSPREVAAELSAERSLPVLPTEIPEVSADELLRTRPDLRAAQERVTESEALVGAARADYLPRVNLAAGAGYAASAVDAFGERGTFNYAFGPVITLPVLDLGRVRARVDQAEAQEAEVRALQEQLRLEAEGELETAAVRYQSTLKRLEHLRDGAAASERAAALALLRYQGGIADFLHVLDAERTMLAAQDLLADGLTRAADAYVALFAARAGRWNTP